MKTDMPSSKNAPTSSRCVAACLLASVVTLCLSPPSQGQLEAKDAPDAAAILDRYIEATGGKAAHEKIYNRVATGRVVHVDMDFEDSIVEYSAAPNKRYAIIESDAFGRIEQGTDGNIVWYLSENTGPLIEQGDARAAALRLATFHHSLKWRELYEKAEFAGETAIGEKPCYKIVMTPVVGKPETRYYAKETGLLVRADGTRLSSHMPPRDIQLTFSDYRWVDGVQIAHQTKQAFEMCGERREILFVMDKIEHNVDLPGNRFASPRQVQAAVLAESAVVLLKNAFGIDDVGTTERARAKCGGCGKASAKEGSSKRKSAPCNQGQAVAKTGARKPCGGRR
jgi:hypothetical protein